tara:strand:+ start:2182 stop:3357 length:1176 start_codon:yes stop_codon:yes gene_type:complete
MVNYFIHFDNLNLSSLRCFIYENGEQKELKSLNLRDEELKILSGSNLFIMMPSGLFGFKEFKNDLGLKEDILKANIFSDIEDSLISDISNLEFFYIEKLNLAAWIDKNIFDDIKLFFNKIDAEIYIYPEHFLFWADNSNTLYFDESNFNFSFKSFLGFSGSNFLLSDYAELLKSDGIEINSLQVFSSNNEIKFAEYKFPKSTVKPLRIFHKNFLENLSFFKDINFFKRRFSYSFIRSKLKLNPYEIYFSAISIGLLLILPLAINISLDSSIKKYNEDTISIFRQLNPGFNRLVNPKAQIDDLTRDIPKQVSLLNQELDVMKYIDQLKDDSVKDIFIDILNNQLIVKVENLPQYKLDLIQSLLNQERVIINDANLIKNNNMFFGSLIIKYDA